MRVALVLGSGGARGYAHIGVIDALRERGFDVVGISGSSMGALVGALQAAGALDEFTAWASSLTQSAVLRLLDPSLTAAGGLRAAICDMPWMPIPDLGTDLPRHAPDFYRPLPHVPGERRMLAAMAVAFSQVCHDDALAWARELAAAEVRVIVSSRDDELPVYEAAGANISFLGNPLVDTVKAELPEKEARAFFGIAPEDHAVLLMPGSRRHFFSHILKHSVK